VPEILFIEAYKEYAGRKTLDGHSISALCIKGGTAAKYSNTLSLLHSGTKSFFIF